MRTTFDIIIVGLGAMGSAAAYQLAGTSKRVLGIDQYTPPHRHGSSHGETRITRQAVGEGRQYIPIVLRSHDIWRQIEAITGQTLLTQCGGLIFGPSRVNAHHHGVDNFLSETIAAAQDFNIKHEVLTGTDLAHRFPQFIYAGDEVGYFERGAGFLRVEECVRVQLELAKNKGVELKTDLQVLSVEANAGNDGGRVVTRQGTYEGEVIIITAGAWVKQFLPAHFRSYFKIFRQVLFWFEADWSVGSYTPETCPIYIRVGDHPTDVFYGLPAIQGRGSGLKLATEQFEESCRAATVNREVTEAEIDAFYDYVSQYVRIKPRCLRSKTCLYTTTRDHQFVIDRLPDHPQIIIASPCSGHGFKHSAGIGAILKDLAVDGQSSLDIDSFSFSRPAHLR